jgi:hypothetical protein
LFNSALEERGNLEIASPVAGLVTSRILSEDEAIHLLSVDHHTLHLPLFPYQLISF